MKHRQIGRYLIKAELKRGGMSTVYLAHDPLFERDVAIKLLPQEMLDKPTLRARFDREARIVASLDHPAIVPVYDFGEKEEQPYIVLRFMLGGSLEDMLHQGPLSLSATAHIIQRLALALDEVHTKGIVHRDLKPSNVLFDQRHEAFISDFGIIRLNTAGARLTSTGDAIGTPAYMSPEQIRGDRMLDGRSDIYALGVILFEMLAGKHPYETQTPMGVAVKHITAPVPPIHHFQPDLPPEIQVILAKAMAKDPDDRYQTAGEMAEAVQMLLAQPVPVKVERGVALRLDTAPVLLTDGPERTNGLVNGHSGVNGTGWSRPQIITGNPTPARPRPYSSWLLWGSFLLLLFIGGGFALTNQLRAEPSPTPTALLVLFATPTPTITATVTNTATPTATPTDRPTMTPTVTPVPTLVPTVVPTSTLVMITATDAAAYFFGPDNDLGQMETFVAAGEKVTALAQSANGSWLLVENEAGEQGWVARNFFAEGEGLDSLPVSAFTLATVDVTPTAAADSFIATWSVASTAPASNGQWQTDLLVSVPAGGSYQFQVADLAINAILQTSENGQAVYRVTVSGMNCVGPLAADLTVTRNGSPLEARNATTGQVQPVFVSPPDC